MYARVVVGTDGSETAAIAVQRAIELAAAMHAELQVVHAHQQLNLKLASVDADARATVAAAVHAQVIVIGNRGMTGMKRFVLGSVPNKVSHHAPCDVLIVNSELG